MSAQNYVAATRAGLLAGPGSGDRDLRHQHARGCHARPARSPTARQRGTLWLAQETEEKIKKTIDSRRWIMAGLRSVPNEQLLLPGRLGDPQRDWRTDPRFDPYTDSL